MPQDKEQLSVLRFFTWFEEHFEFEETCQSQTCLKAKYEEQKRQVIEDTKHELIEAYESGVLDEYEHHLNNESRQTAQEYLKEKFNQLD